MNRVRIERKTRQLIKAIWERRYDPNLFLAGPPNRLEVLDPGVAAAVLGITYVIEEGLTTWGSGVEIAGLIDRQARKIAISRQFDPTVMRFTGAHELGHWLLHPDAVMHRDRPVKGLSTTWRRSPQEAEADYFAACFLMPRKLVREVLEDKFQVATPIMFDEMMAQQFAPDDPYRLIYPEEDKLDREFAIASAESFSGRHFHSLAKQFQVSTQSMAIRLHELELIRK